MLVTIWTKANCVQCTQSKKLMDRLGIRYEEMNLEKHPEQTQAFIDAGLTAAPIVVTDIKRWSGFRMDKIQSLASYLHADKAKE